MILTQTPLRVSLFGGGTDYPEWFQEHGGAVLGMAIDKYCYVGVKPMPPGQLGADGAPLRYRVQYSKVDDCQRVEDIRHPAVRAAVRYFNTDQALEFHCFGDLPGRSGLGSSSSFTVGLLHALQHQLGLSNHVPLLDLAREAIPFEQHVIREAVGCQDQIFAAVGGLRFITFDVTQTQVETVSIPEDRLAELENSLVLVYSGSMRDAHLMAAQQVARVKQNTRLLLELQRQAHTGHMILTDPHFPLLGIGKLLDHTWWLKRELHPEISNPEIDALYHRGIRLGAVGGKLLGAGGGGFFLFFVPPECREAFEKSIGAPCVHFHVVHTGSRVIVS